MIFNNQKSMNAYPIHVIMVNALILSMAIGAIARQALQESCVTKVMNSPKIFLIAAILT